MLSLARKAFRTFREARMVTWGFLHKDHPVLAQIIPMRRCNLACAYCNEYDKTSAPVPLDEMLRRIDKLAALGTSVVTFSGGEPMMHPELDVQIARVRERGMIAGLITNGFYLGPERIKRLNRAGLDHLQISIDNVEPDEVSQKSLKTLDKKLHHLAEHAEFHVNINSVVGADMAHPEDVLVILRRAIELGFSTSVGILHDESGQLKPLSPSERSIYDTAVRMGNARYTRINDFQQALINGQPNDWSCRAGSRYLYICEDGLVHYCSQKRGAPAIPLARYSVDDIRREWKTEKECAPYCTIGCVHRACSVDMVRDGRLHTIGKAILQAQA